VFVYCSPLLLQDFPNHLARAVVMSDLLFDHGRQFGQAFTYHFLFVPYVLADWLLAGMVRVLGLTGATPLFPVLVFLSLPAALYIYLRAQQASAAATVTVLLISLYLSTDTFFLLGLLSFRLAVAWVLLAMAVAELLSRRWSGMRYVALVAVVILGYLTHLTALAFMVIALGTRSLIRMALRISGLGRECLLLLPIGCLVIWHFAIAVDYRQSTDQTAETYIRGTPLTKAAGPVWEFLGYRSYWQLMLLVTFGLCLVALAWRSARSWTQRQGREGRVPQAAVLVPWAIALAFLCVYVVLPSSYSEASFVDVRALAPFWLFLLVGLARMSECSVPGPSCRGSPAFVLAGVLAALGIGYLGKQLREKDAWLDQYRSVVAKVPQGSRVLPVYTGKGGVVRSSLHAGSYVVMDRLGLIPYLFSGDRGDPMKYFRYVNRPYAPDEGWYVSDLPVSWTEVAANYSFLLVMRPFEPARIRLQGRTVAANEAAILLDIR